MTPKALRPFAALVAAALTGCFASQPSKPVVEFPTMPELQALSAQPAPTLPPMVPEPSGEGWTLQGPLPPIFSEALWQPAEPAESELAVALQSAHHRMRFTQSMACVARELGRFYADKSAFPQETFKTFVLGACGAVAIDVSVGGFAVEYAKQSDAALAKSIVKDLKAQGQRALKGLEEQLVDAGVWVGRQGAQTFMVYAIGQPLAQITRGVWTPGASGHVRFDGRTTRPAEYISAYINRGRFGVQPCVVDISVALPDFRVICEMDPDDNHAWVEILFVEPKHVWMRPLFRTLARRALPPLVYQRDDFGLQEDDSQSSSKENHTELINKLNLVRKAAALKQVQAADLEMQTAQSLAPHFFAAAYNNDLEATAKLSMGLLAGWRAGGMIRSGSLISASVPDTRSPLQWLIAALQTPMGRTTLLAPDVEKVSVGAVAHNDPDGLSAVVTGWAFHHENNHLADVVAIYKRIIAARQRLGLPMVSRLGAITGSVNHALEAVHKGQETPMGALEAALQIGVDRYGANMRGYVVEAMSIDAITIPEELLATTSLALEVGVTHHKAPGAAWAQFVVIIAYIDEGQTAMAPRR